VSASRDRIIRLRPNFIASSMACREPSSEGNACSRERTDWVFERRFAIDAALGQRPPARQYLPLGATGVLRSDDPCARE
jgi:hypothetical protein